MTIWKRWVRQPHTLWLRRALFQVHLWTGIGVGLYILLISLTGACSSTATSCSGRRRRIRSS